MAKVAIPMPNARAFRAAGWFIRRIEIFRIQQDRESVPKSRSTPGMNAPTEQIDEMKKLREMVKARDIRMLT